MPDYFSHYICAEKIFEKLDAQTRAQIPNRNLYLLGAQGGDVFFAYSVKFSRSNPGRDLHVKNPAELFCMLADGNPSYAAGWASHYALDCTLHPAIYALEKETKSPLGHQKIESDLGLFISKYYAMRRRILPRESVLPGTGAVYDSMKPIAPFITVTGVERCLKRHFGYTRYIYKTKKQAYKYGFDYSSFAGAVEEAVTLGVQAVKCVLSKDIDGVIFKKEFLQR